MTDYYTCPDCDGTTFKIVHESELAETECQSCGEYHSIVGLVPPGRKN